MREIEEAVSAAADDAAAFLEEILAIPSVEGAELEVQQVIAQALGGLGLDVEFIPIDESVRSHPAYTAGAAISFEGRPNVAARLRGSGKGRSLIINTHSDVVPAKGWGEAFLPRREGQVMRGRGAVDAKGQIAALCLALRALRDTETALAGDLEVQVVIDEEVGGNGSLSLILAGHTADAAVVLEPTSLRLHPANRGALWFRFTVEGTGGHMAHKFDNESAIDHSIELAGILYEFEAELLEGARRHPLFSMYEHPVQVNIGKITAGDWPAAVAGKAVVEGGVGFLGDSGIEEVKRALVEFVDARAGAWLASHYECDFFGLHNDAFETPLDAPVVSVFRSALEVAGLPAEPTGWVASCDARLLARVGSIDTIVFGAGDLSLAHSTDERLNLGEMEQAAAVLARFIIDWCGRARPGG